MVLRVDFPPKLLRKMSCPVAHGFQIIEILCRDFLEHFAHAPHRNRRQAIGYTSLVELLTEIPHELAPLGLVRLFERARQLGADMFHSDIVQELITSSYLQSVENAR